MIDWYVTHVYVLPWWAYALMLYPCAGCLFAHLIGASGQPEIDFVFVLMWPLFAGGMALPMVFGVFLWLVGLKDTFPLSYSEDGKLRP